MNDNLKKKVSCFTAILNQTVMHFFHNHIKKKKRKKKKKKERETIKMLIDYYSILSFFIFFFFNFILLNLIVTKCNVGAATVHMHEIGNTTPNWTLLMMLSLYVQLLSLGAFSSCK